MFVLGVAEGAVDCKGKQRQREIMPPDLNAASHSQEEQCSLPSQSVTTVPTAGERGVDGALHLEPTWMKLSIYFASKRIESIEAVGRSFCLEAN